MQYNAVYKSASHFVFFFHPSVKFVYDYDISIFESRVERRDGIGTVGSVAITEGLIVTAITASILGRKISKPTMESDWTEAILKGTAGQKLQLGGAG